MRLLQLLWLPRMRTTRDTSSTRREYDWETLWRLSKNERFVYRRLSWKGRAERPTAISLVANKAAQPILAGLTVALASYAIEKYLK
ncbi:hypothetical protein PROFUN_10838 [Planoprotostelium fungivorum]|uniref:Uncharacterized protein n=1 Tax=Planoprotostelium fungivorum TaxID=1890364 RepID=A0A2P6NCR8_9EUKA|nr:hypothetical protein PROFUN_10838 [Planoprotostelium fungivorum]